MGLDVTLTYEHGMNRQPFVPLRGYLHSGQVQILQACGEIFLAELHTTGGFMTLRPGTPF